MISEIDLSAIPVIDSHCHPFDPVRDKGDFRLHFSLSMWEPSLELTTNTVFSYKVIRELGKLLGCATEDFDEISKERDRQYRRDPKAYIDKLFKSVNLETLILDTGYPHEEWVGYSVDLDSFSRLVPCKIYPICRIEPIVYKIFKKFPKTFDEAKEFFNSEIEKAVKVEKVVAFKSIIAYATGLELKHWSEKEAEDAYNRFIQKPYQDYTKHPPGPDEKILRDYFAVMALLKCRENDIPMQFHTGMGGAPTLDLRKANPILMQDILAVEEVKETKVVLAHAGFPFCEEAAMLTSSYPNLYCDMSAISNFMGTAMKSAMLKIFELAPVNRVLFGTDGVTMPESYWIGVKQGVKGLEQALVELINEDWITEKDANRIAKMILNENAKKLYKLK
jgi:predicted TIM-barrel fold metal-dependent hydrolase